MGESATNTEENDKAPKNMNGRAFWCFFVLCHPRKHIQTTKKHQKARKAPKCTDFEGGGEAETEKNKKEPKSTKKHGCSRKERKGQAQETAEAVLRLNAPRLTPPSLNGLDTNKGLSGPE